MRGPPARTGTRGDQPIDFNDADHALFVFGGLPIAEVRRLMRRISEARPGRVHRDWSAPRAPLARHGRRKSWMAGPPLASGFACSVMTRWEHPAMPRRGERGQATQSDRHTGSGPVTAAPSPPPHHRRPVTAAPSPPPVTAAPSPPCRQHQQHRTGQRARRADHVAAAIAAHRGRPRRRKSAAPPCRRRT